MTRQLPQPLDVEYVSSATPNIAAIETLLSSQILAGNSGRIRKTRERTLESQADTRQDAVDRRVDQL